MQDHRQRVISPTISANAARSFSAAGCIKAQCEGTETGNGKARLAPLVLASDAAPVYRSLVSGNHHLARRVVIDGFEHLALCRFGTHRPHHVVIEAEHCGHCAYAFRDRRLHRFGTQANQFHRIGKIQRSCAGTKAVYSPRLCRPSCAGHRRRPVHCHKR
jgi:hypothetical protein